MGRGTVIAVWLLCVVGGVGLVWRRESKPSAAGRAPARWPVNARIAHDPHRATIVLFAHPQCPCTRASITELDSLLSAVGDRVVAHVVFVRPDGESDAWLQSASWARARALPHTDVIEDPNGSVARVFGAQVSGQTVVYDARGDLLFSGGITLSRGHIGDNPGRSRIVALLTTGTASRHDSPVFGCALFDSSAD